jgi:hypothetical protein
MDQKTALIASIPEREDMLKLTVASLRPQVNRIFVSLNGYDHVPDFVDTDEYVLLDNSMGDAAKFYFAEQCKGYILTCDDDLIYPLGYVDKMVAGVEKYKCPCSLHGRFYSRPVMGFQESFFGFPCLNDVMTDVEVDVGGDGVMCWHTDLLKIRFEDFKQKNMSQLYFSKVCHEQGVKIMCLAHRTGYLKYQFPGYTIWDESAKEGFKKQTELLKSFLV